MSASEEHSPKGRRKGIPRDLPDQEAEQRAERETGYEGAEYRGTEGEVPDTDEAGSGPRWSGPPSGEREGEPPEPEEPTD